MIFLLLSSHNLCFRGVIGSGFSRFFYSLPSSSTCDLFLCHVEFAQICTSGSSVELLSTEQCL